MIKNRNSIDKMKILFGNSIGKQEYVDSYINNIINSFELSPSYYKITKNNDLNTFYDAWILDTEKAYKSEISEKKIIMKPGQTLNKGDYINWENNVWLCVKKDSQKTYYDDGLIQICNKILKYNYNGLSFEIPCIISKIGRNAMTLENNQIIMSPNFYGIITIPYNSILKKIPLNARFLFDEFAYRVIGKDSITFTEGIVELKIQQDDIRIGVDDFVNGYADQSNLKSNNYSINIINNNISAKIGDNPIQLNVQLLNNNVPVSISNNQFIFTSNNTNVATIDNNGLVDFISEGVASISVSLLSDNTVISTANVTVFNAVVVDNYSIAFNSGSATSIILNGQANYSVTIMNNGKADTTGKTVNFVLNDVNGNPTNIASLINITGTSCTIKASGIKGTVILKSIFKDNNSVINTMSVSIKSAF